MREIKWEGGEGRVALADEANADEIGGERGSEGVKEECNNRIIHKGK